MSKTITTATVLLLAAMPYLPCLADYVSENEFVDVKEGVRYEYRQRLKDLKEQIEMGTTKGWIDADQAASLNAEHDRLVKATKKAKEAGWPKDQVDPLEKDVTAFSARVSKALSKGSPKANSGNKNK
jgi:hypothetical protein